MPLRDEWTRPDQDLGALIARENAGSLVAYRAKPHLLDEHANIEARLREGGYRGRQIYEVVQNAADAARSLSDARIELRLTDDCLYVANNGDPVTGGGVVSLLYSHLSDKRDDALGRFGLGFKSLLGVSNEILVLSWRVSVAFEEARSRAELAQVIEVVPERRVPVTRFGWPVDVSAVFEADTIARELAEWASTIVRVRLTASAGRERLAHELESFPAEFVLVAREAGSLTIVSRWGKHLREITASADTDDTIRLRDVNGDARWRLFRRQARISDPEANEDAGDLHRRDHYQLTWAVPLVDRPSRGAFWAGFRLNDGAPTPGVVNAPWKTNDDRSSVLEGPFNAALLQEMAQLMIDSLPALASAQDPGAPLDYLPRRESDTFAGQEFARRLWPLARTAAIVADARGVLVRVDQLALHPKVDEPALDRWVSCASDEIKAKYVHPSCLGRERAARLIQLKDSDVRAGLADWLGAVALAELEACKKVLLLVEAIAKTNKDMVAEMRRAAIVLTSAGRLVAAERACFATGAAVPAGFSTVHEGLLEDAVSRRILETALEVRPLDDSQWRILLDAKLESRAWNELWTVLRQAPESAVDGFLAAHGSTVKVKSGSWWVDVHEALRPGAIVSLEDAGHPLNKDAVIDVDFHATDGALLDKLGVSDAPTSTSTVAGRSEPWQRYWLSAHDWFVAANQGRSTPHGGTLVLSPPGVTVPLRLLAEGSAPVRVRMTAWLLERLAPFATRMVVHRSRSNYYHACDFHDPVAWLILTDGQLDVGNQPIPVNEMWALRDEPWLAGFLAKNRVDQLRRLSKGLLLTAPGIRTNPMEPRTWRLLFQRALSADVNDDARRGLYIHAARNGHVPEKVRAGGREVVISELTVCETDFAGTGSAPVLSLPFDVCEAFAKRGAKRLGPPGYSPLDVPEALVDFEPMLERMLTDRAPTGLAVLRVRDLHRMISETRQALDVWLDGATLLVDSARYAGLESQERGRGLRVICDVLAERGFLKATPERVLQSVLSDRVLHLRAHIASADTLETRVLRAVGEKPEPILECLPPEAQSVLMVSGATPTQMATVALATHGPNLLKVLKPSLERQGLGPPARWGGPAALEFVESLGFPAEFGGHGEERRAPSIDVEGPVPLLPLHDFQDDVRRELVELLAQGRQRALVNLPTGAGKTRVVVQTLVEALNAHTIESPVLWVAQGDELCEQAVVCFAEVWSNYGIPRTRLRVSRLWGGHSESIDSRVRPHVVVATIQTLYSRFGQTSLAWLKTAGVVVIDEGHHATTSSYTDLIQRLETEDDELPPIIGLTATAFRGFSEEQTRRLANRFHRRIVPATPTPEQLLRRLQDEGVLAKVALTPLESGEEIVLTPDEQVHFEQFKGDVPDTVLARLAESKSRNEIILEAVRARPDARILLFALSVGHARQLATRLTLEGRIAAAVDASTATETRRYLIASFRAGTISVLVNYGVLTTGFDAPKTDVVLIARPTISPNLYQQMIGRGLRGVKNGGKPSCEIITLRDNFGRFGESLAFEHFREFFSNVAQPAPAEEGAAQNPG